MSVITLNVIVKFTFSELLALLMFEFRCTLCLRLKSIFLLLILRSLCCFLIFC